jgi:hypothetical protein
MRVRVRDPGEKVAAATAATEARKAEMEKVLSAAKIKEYDAVIRNDGTVSGQAYGQSAQTVAPPAAPPAPGAPNRPAAMAAHKECDFFVEMNAAAAYLARYRCDFDVKRQVPNPIDGGSLDLEYIALASYLEARKGGGTHTLNIPV